MRYRIVCVLIGLVLAASIAVSAFAQADEDAAASERALFVRIVDPAEDDVEVTLTTTTIVIVGTTLNDAILSVDGELVDVDDQGGFSAVAELDEGLNEIEIIASDADGNQVTKTLFVVRGDA
jgi:hypothetical protein